MDVGLFLDSLPGTSLATALGVAVDLGLTSVEVGTGGYSPGEHGDLKALLADRTLRTTWHSEFQRRGVSIVALNVSGNPLHPVEDRARPHDEALRDTLRLAGELGVTTVVAMSGCPGTPDGSTAPHWSVGGWLPDFEGIYEWQWQEQLLPYWNDVAEIARSSGVTQICLEMHPGMMVSNPHTLLRLREAIGPRIAANLDPSHFFWQGMDPLVGIAALRGAIGHVHAKDTYVSKSNVAVNGVLDGRWVNLAVQADGASAPSVAVRDLPWYFCTLGYGHGSEYWSAFVATLLANGYDGTLSIEHEDPLIAPADGVAKAATFLGAIVPTPA
jgi:sugar phosphate isomerase/epimerase